MGLFRGALGIAVAMLVAAPCAAAADGVYALAIGNGGGGAIDYVAMADGTLDGAFAYVQGDGKIGWEKAQKQSPGTGFPGRYATNGVALGSSYKAVLDVTAVGRDDALDIDVYDLAWNNGDKGIAVGSGPAMVGAFGMHLVGTMVEYNGRIDVALYMWSNSRLSVFQYKLDGTGLVGSHKMIPSDDRSPADTLTIVANGESFRVTSGGGMTGVAYPIRDRSSGPAVASAPAAPAEPAAASPRGPTAEKLFGCSATAGALAILAESSDPAAATHYDAEFERIADLGVRAASAEGMTDEEARKLFMGLLQARESIYTTVPEAIEAEKVTCVLEKILVAK